MSFSNNSSKLRPFGHPAGDFSIQDPVCASNVRQHRGHKAMGWSSSRPTSHNSTSPASTPVHLGCEQEHIRTLVSFPFLPGNTGMGTTVRCALKIERSKEKLEIRSWESGWTTTSPCQPGGSCLRSRPNADILECRGVGHVHAGNYKANLYEVESSKTSLGLW